MRTGISWLDFKLGLRMLVKHPALTVVGGLGMAVAIAISVGFFSFINLLVFPTLPLPEGERIVALENRDLEVNDEERRSLHDFVAWREELQSVQDLGAFRTVQRNLVPGAAPPEPVQVAEMSAAGFRVARVPPLLGRYLIEEDERPGAAPVVVIGYDVWQNRFGGDPAIVGRDLRLDGRFHTVVGVMPEGFAFPENHRFWIPLRADPSAYGRREGPAIFIFGRLAPGVTMEEAQAELAAIGQRTAAALPETHAQLRPMVMPYTHSLTDIQGISLWEVAQMQFLMTLLLLVVALNVAVLVYARTATRQGELAVRSALGASRGRITGQLFAEALVLSLGAAALGLALAQVGIRLGTRILELEMEVGVPFWMDYGLRPVTVFYTVGLAVLAAVLVGVLPALQATGRRLQSDLRQLGGGTGMRLGKTWTALIVAQIAIAVALLPAAAAMSWDEIGKAATRPTYPAEEFLAAALTPEMGVGPEVGAGATPAEGAARFGERLSELMRRLEAEPEVAGVTFRASLPGRGPRIEVEGVAAAAESSDHTVSAFGIDPAYFELFGARILTGRSFGSEDLGAEGTAVIVDQAFVRQVLGGGNALGRRIRHVSEQGAAESGQTEPERWYEIVGVVESLLTNPSDPDLVRPSLSYPVAPNEVERVSLALRLRGTTPADFAPKLRQITAAVDPSLRLGTVHSLAEGGRQQQIVARLVGLVVGLVLLSVFLLSAAGVYALLSFTVTQRRREIGIRSALGAHPRQLLWSVFSRAAGQIGLGLTVGATAAVLLESLTGGELMGGRGTVVLPAIALIMALVGLLAALGPARRGLRIKPMEALRAE